jgi:hypothetical protein
VRATTARRDHEHEEQDDCMDDVALSDGRYDAFVVWAEARDADHVAFELTVTTGAHKGEVITVIARTSADPFARIGLPCTLIVEAGAPRIDFSEAPS